MKQIILFSFLLISFSSFSQTYIHKAKAQVKKELNDFILTSDSTKATLIQSDTALILSVSGYEGTPATFIYKFDKAGKCNSEKVTTSCDSCYQKYLEAALNRKQYNWKKINGNQYISDFNSKMMIELPTDKTDFSYIILKTDWSKQMYDLLSGN